MEKLNLLDFSNQEVKHHANFFPLFLVDSYEIVQIKKSLFLKEYVYSYFLK